MMMAPILITQRWAPPAPGLSSVTMPPKQMASKGSEFGLPSHCINQELVEENKALIKSLPFLQRQGTQGRAIMIPAGLCRVRNSPSTSGS